MSKQCEKDMRSLDLTTFLMPSVALWTFWRTFILIILTTWTLHIHSTLAADSCVDSGDYCQTLRPDECYHNDKYCCRSCLKYAIEQPGCKYGDRASVCTDDYCYFTWNLDLCCHTCRNNFTTTTVTTTVTQRGTTEERSTTPVATNQTSVIITTSPSQPCFDGVINGMSCDKYIEANGIVQCYRYEDVCCRTCRDQRVNNAGECSYGDRKAWCKTVERSQCYTSGDICCKTCETMKSHISDCQYGDYMPSFCSTLLSWDCYEEHTFCCETCSLLKVQDAPPGCEYGDRTEAKECMLYAALGCATPAMRKKCCYTCSTMS